MDWKVIIGALCLLLLAGCGREEYKSEYFINCVEGIYSIPDWAMDNEKGFLNKAFIEDSGIEIDYLRIAKTADVCEARLVFKEEVDLGIIGKTKTLNLAKCNQTCARDYPETECCDYI